MGGKSFSSGKLFGLDIYLSECQDFSAISNLSKLAVWKNTGPPPLAESLWSRSSVKQPNYIGII